MTRPLEVTVFGTPAPQGSKSYKGQRNGKPILVESSKRVKPWRAAVADATRAAIYVHGSWSFPECPPMRVYIEFLIQAPKRMPRGRTRPVTVPDLDKLVRSTLDGLTEAGAWVDDAYVVEVHATKHYAADQTGALITIRPIEGD